MARHRDVRNMDYGSEVVDEDDDYGSSLGGGSSETFLSASVENTYIYKRNQSGTTPKMSHFFHDRLLPPEEERIPDSDDEDDNEDDFDSDRSSNLSRQNSLTGAEFLATLNPEDQIRFNACLEKIQDIVGEAIPESVIRDAIVKCDYDYEVTLNTIYNKSQPSKPARRRKNVDTNRRKEPEIRKKPEIAAEIRKQPEIVPEFKVPPVIVTEKKEERSRSRSQSPVVDSSGRNSPNPPSTPLQQPQQQQKVAMRKQKVDVLKEYEKYQQESKDLLNLVVVGHVDSGKSTLMGHLLVNLGNVNSKTMHKYESESRKVGKQSFCYAWVLDETSEERNRGITMDVGHNKFCTPTKNITLLDAPGHRDFIPNMISGAYQADVAILVVNATRGEFEAGFDSGGQTREHGLLVRSLGVGQLVVAVNKLDTVDWSQERFEEIKKKLSAFLKQVGFKSEDVTYIPVSGFTGDNLTKRADEKLRNWSNKHEIITLLEAIDNFKPPERLVEKPFRMSVSDVFKPQSAGFSVAGRIESGFVQKEDKILVMPLNELGTVKAVMVDDSTSNSSLSCGFAGDHVTLTLTGPDQTSVSSGMVVCDPQNPIPTTKRFRARIVVFAIDIPITKGFPVILHYGCVQVQATIKKLLAEINKSTGVVSKSKPRCILKNCNASVEIVLESPIALELYSNIKELGRFMLRSNGKTIAAGIVTDIL